MYQFSCCLEYLVDALNNVSLAQHDLVPERHKPVLHVGFDACDQMYPVGKELSVNLLAQHCPSSPVLVADIGRCKTECYDFSPIVAEQMQLEVVTPSHRPLAVSSYVLEYFVGIVPEIIAHGNHRGVSVGDACTPAKGTELQDEHHLKEQAALQFHEAVIGNGLG